MWSRNGIPNTKQGVKSWSSSINLESGGNSGMFDDLEQGIFVDSVKKLYNDGVRLFIEVGPSNVLSNLASNILNEKDVHFITTNKKNVNSVETYKKVIGELFTLGIDVNIIPNKDILNMPIYDKKDIKVNHFKAINKDNIA